MSLEDRMKKAIKEILSVDGCLDSLPHDFDLWNEYLFHNSKVQYKCVRCHLIWPGSDFNEVMNEPSIHNA